MCPLFVLLGRKPYRVCRFQKLFLCSFGQAVQKDIEYVARDVEKRRGNIFVDNGGDLSTRYVESRNTIEADSKIVMDWKVM